jgi:menaquinone-dependent protoporphyrinogen oxidase
MSTMLVVCHTSERQTARIAQHVAAVLRAFGDTVDVHDVAGAPLPEAYDAVVVGDSFHTVCQSRAIGRYLRDHAMALGHLPTALFEVSLEVTPDALPAVGAEGAVQDLLHRTGFDPDVVGLFAGALVYTRYGWVQRRAADAISSRVVDEIDLRHDREYTDWQAVEQFARDVHALVQAAAITAS